MTTILPLPDSSTKHVDDKGKPTKDLYNWLKSLQAFLNDTASIKASLGLATVATTGAYSDLTGKPVDNSAWTSYTPTITANSGTFTTVSATGRYKQIGKTVFLQVAITITTNGSAAAAVNATLPVTATSNINIISGREEALTGKMLQGVIATTGMVILNYDNTYPGGSGFVLIMSGVYEAA